MSEQHEPGTTNLTKLFHEPADSTLEMVHTFGRCVDVDWGPVGLLRYTIAPGVPIEESPRPFAHPICLPNGEIISGDRPQDHVWHRGLNFGWGYVNDQNFWGGGTFVKGKGYVRLDNNGEMRHQAWRELGIDHGHARLVHELHWLDSERRHVLTERRAVTVHRPQDLDGRDLSPYDDGVLKVGPEVTPAGYFITVDTVMEAVGPTAPLTFGSPMIAGREDPSGYSGLSLRMVRDLTRGRVLTASGHDGTDAAIGKQDPWLHYSGKLDETTTPVGVAAFDHPENPRYPTRWFVRSANWPMVGPAFIWATPYELEVGEPLRLRYGWWVHQGEADAERVGAAHERWLGDQVAQLPDAPASR